MMRRFAEEVIAGDKTVLLISLTGVVSVLGFLPEGVANTQS